MVHCQSGVVEPTTCQPARASTMIVYLHINMSAQIINRSTGDSKIRAAWKLEKWHIHMLGVLSWTWRHTLVVDLPNRRSLGATQTGVHSHGVWWQTHVCGFDRSPPVNALMTERVVCWKSVSCGVGNKTDKQRTYGPGRNYDRTRVQTGGIPADVPMPTSPCTTDVTCT